MHCAGVHRCSESPTRAGSNADAPRTSGASSPGTPGEWCRFPARRSSPLSGSQRAIAILRLPRALIESSRCLAKIASRWWIKYLRLSVSPMTSLSYCSVQLALGCAVTFKCARRRVPCSMMTNTYCIRNVAVTAKKKSQARIPLAWLFRSVDQLRSPRGHPGGRLGMYLRTVRGEIRIPSLSSSSLLRATSVARERPLSGSKPLAMVAVHFPATGLALWCQQRPSAPPRAPHPPESGLIPSSIVQAPKRGPQRRFPILVMGRRHFARRVCFASAFANLHVGHPPLARRPRPRAISRGPAEKRRRPGRRCRSQRTGSGAARPVARPPPPVPSRGGAPAAPQPSLPVSPDAAAPPTGLPQVERRQVTVVFADLSAQPLSRARWTRRISTASCTGIATSARR
jgi:hypothetical protein